MPCRRSSLLSKTQLPVTTPWTRRSASCSWWATAGRSPPCIATPPGRRDPTSFRDAEEQLGAYFAGELTDFDLPLAPSGSAFQLRVWAALTQIPYGETRSYGEIASTVGRPDAFRAVGATNGRNPIAVVVPCHRVIGSDGSLIGYGGGLDRKRILLELEAEH